MRTFREHLFVHAVWKNFTVLQPGEALLSRFLRYRFTFLTLTIRTARSWLSLQLFTNY